MELWRWAWGGWWFDNPKQGCYNVGYPVVRLLYVINAGDGAGHHPTQALADAFTLWRQGLDLSRCRVALVGDVAHARVARTALQMLPCLGVASVVCVGPPHWLPRDLPPGIQVSSDLEAVLPSVDVVMMLRAQRERWADEVEGPVHVSNDQSRWAMMPPGASDWGRSIVGRLSADVDWLSQPGVLIRDQVHHGVMVRSALLAAQSVAFSRRGWCLFAADERSMFGVRSGPL